MRTGTIYMNAETQTPRPDDVKRMLVGSRFHRDTQTVDTKQQFSQVQRDHSTQTQRPDVYVFSDDTIIIPFAGRVKYQDADAWKARRNSAAIVIQSLYRRFIAHQKVNRVRKITENTRCQLEDAERQCEEALADLKLKQMNSLMNPSTSQDFLMLHRILNRWHHKEAEKIKSSNENVQEQFVRLLSQEVQFIQRIDRLKTTKAHEQRKTAVNNILNSMNALFKWDIDEGKGLPVEMDSKPKQRSRELCALYDVLQKSVEDKTYRLQLLLNVKYTVQEFEANQSSLPREIISLLDRETELLTRLPNVKLLAGLRKRLVTLFLQFIRTPEFNPESAKFHPLPSVRREALDAQKQPSKIKVIHDTNVEPDYKYCVACANYKSVDAFAKNTHCQSCENVARIALPRRNENSALLEMTQWMREADRECEEKLVKIQDKFIERVKTKFADSEQAISSVKTFFGRILATSASDTVLYDLPVEELRKIVDNSWCRKSAFSGSALVTENAAQIPAVEETDLSLLTFVRWNPLLPLTSSNCIALEKSQVTKHNDGNIGLVVKMLHDSIEHGKILESKWDNELQIVPIRAYPVDVQDYVKACQELSTA